MPATATDPTVFIVIGNEAAAFNEGGEIIVTDWVPSELIDWDQGTIADHRGAGGEEGFFSLYHALMNAEMNARNAGVHVVRITS